MSSGFTSTVVCQCGRPCRRLVNLPMNQRKYATDAEHAVIAWDCTTRPVGEVVERRKGKYLVIKTTSKSLSAFQYRTLAALARYG